MQIQSTNLRHTTREHHPRFRTYYIKPRGAAAQYVELPMPLINDVPALWPTRRIS